jgi:thiamine kinase-like enzyme
MKYFFFLFFCFSSLFAEENIERIERIIVQKWRGGQPVSIQQVNEGLSNQNYRLVSSDRSFFVRCAPEQNSLLGTSIDNEWQVSSLTASFGLSPQVYFFDSEERVMISEWINIEDRKVNLRDSKSMQKFCALLRKLHSMSAPFPKLFSPFRCIREYARSAVESGAMLPESFEEIVFPKIEEIEAAFLGRTKLVPCHLDLYSLNVLDNGIRYYLTDWEYAAMSDPLFDLATTPSADLFSDEEMFQLLDVYLQRPSTRKERRDFYCMRILADARWALWAYIQEKISPIKAPYGDYAAQFLEQCLLRISLLSLKREL